MSFTVRTLREEKAVKKPSSRSWKPALNLLAKASGPLLYWGHVLRERHEKRQKEEQRVNLLKRVLVILVTILCAFLLVAGATKALVSLQILSLQNIVGVAGTPLPIDAHGHTNILLLGQGDAGHDGIDLTDTIMIASLDPEKTKSAVLLSLPRDLYFLETEKMGTDRINSLYRNYKVILQREGKTAEEASQMAMQELAAEISRKLNIDIHHVIKVDFIGFVQAVDAIGGIDIVVPETLVDTEYPGPNYSYQTFTIQAGPQHIDGETALKYARSRHSTSDFDRSARQQQIIEAVGDKMQSEGTLTKPNQILDLISILQEHVLTTLSVREMVSLARAGKNLDRSKLISIQVNDRNGLFDAYSEPGGFLYNPPRDQFGGASVLLPVSIPEFPVTWKQLQAFTELLIHQRAAHAEKAPLIIHNAGAVAGSARKVGGELIRYGFNVATMENGEEDRLTSRIVAPEGSVTAELLSRLLDMEWVKTTPLPQGSSEGQVGSSPVTIELGEDYEYAPIQNAVLTSSLLTE